MLKTLLYLVGFHRKNPFLAPSYYRVGGDVYLINRYDYAVCH